MQPLKNKTVLITSSEHQSSEFTKQLEDLGAKTISLPLIKTTPIKVNDIIPENYDWIIFTSTNAVKYFFESIPLKTIESKIAVVGKKTKEAIEDLGLKVDFIPSEFTAKNLANEIPVTKNESVLIPTSNLSKNDIIEILENRKCIVNAVSIYKNKPIDYSKTELNKIFLQQIDYITFTSGSIVDSFMKLGVKLHKEKIICIGPETEKVAKKYNLKISGIANPHTIDGMVNSIINLL